MKKTVNLIVVTCCQLFIACSSYQKPVKIQISDIQEKTKPFLMVFIPYQSQFYKEKESYQTLQFNPASRDIIMSNSIRTLVEKTGAFQLSEGKYGKDKYVIHIFHWGSEKFHPFPGTTFGFFATLLFPLRVDSDSLMSIYVIKDGRRIGKVWNYNNQSKFWLFPIPLYGLMFGSEKSRSMIASMKHQAILEFLRDFDRNYGNQKLAGNQ